MSGVFSGYLTIGVLIALGIGLAHWKVIGTEGQHVLSTIAIYVATPALLITVLQDSDIGAVLSGDVIATGTAVLVTVALSVIISAARRQSAGEGAIYAMCTSYANVGNLGLPVAAYVLGDPALIAPLLLLQMLVLLPVALTVMDFEASGDRIALWRRLIGPVKNPITVAAGVGLAIALAGLRLPDVVMNPLTLMGGMAVPSMLIAYGISLRLGPLPGRGAPAVELGSVVLLKLVTQPLVAFAMGHFVLDLTAPHLLAVTVLSALPTAQNVFVLADRYRRSSVLARDAIFLTTILSVPAITATTALLA